MLVATKPIPVRLDPTTIERLDAAANRLGTNRASLIAFCAKTFAEDFEKQGEAIMPPDWRVLFARMDGRTKIATNPRMVQIDTKPWAINDAVNSKPASQAANVLKKKISKKVQNNDLK